MVLFPRLELVVKKTREGKDGPRTTKVALHVLLIDLRVDILELDLQRGRGGER